MSVVFVHRGLGAPADARVENVLHKIGCYTR